jgi:hypothetical protein
VLLTVLETAGCISIFSAALPILSVAYSVGDSVAAFQGFQERLISGFFSLTLASSCRCLFTINHSCYVGYIQLRNNTHL